MSSTTMNLSLHSSSAWLTYPCDEGRRCSSYSSLLRGRYIGMLYYYGEENVQVSNLEARKLPLSSHLMSKRLEGSFMGKKRLQDSAQKLEYARTLLIDNYDSYTYNIYQELSVVNGLPPVVVRNNDWAWEDVCYYLYEEKAFDNIVISPGPGSPTCPDDIGICLRLLAECRDIPILGVCLGHQALGYAHGAKVVHATEPVHGRLSELEHNGCRLFHGIPSGRNSGFKVVRYHSLVIDPETLPKELIPISWTYSTDALTFLEHEKTSCESQSRIENSGYLDSFFSTTERAKERKVLMGIMHSTRPHYGVQFHPESVATCHGRQIFKNFREITEDYWMRLKLSNFNNGNGHHAACMQVSHASKLFSEVPRRKSIMNDVAGKSYGEACSISNIVHKKDTGDCLSKSGVKNLKLRWKKLDNLAGKVGGAKNIFTHLFGQEKAENTFWLDSSSIEKGRARFSFIGGRGGSLWKQMIYRLSDESEGGGFLRIEDAQGSARCTFLEKGFLDFLNTELSSFRYEEEDYEGLPFDFHGGFIGYIGYGLKVECSVALNRHKSRTPDACFFFADNLIVIDHHNDDVYIMCIQEESTTITSWFDDTEQKLIRLKAPATPKQRSQNITFSPWEAGFVAEKSKEEYITDIEKCMKYIRDGESYELCLTTQIRKSIGEINSLELYLKLRDKNPAPYAAWLNFSTENLCICCSSPERFLKLNRDGLLEAKPIKGTIARGSTMEEDEQLKLQLQYSKKDQAENLMIVDLLRNDLGRVCEVGSVHVLHLMEVESYATVHTMVSTIRGKKQSNISPVDCVRAAFPGGSMTGAPKLRSMEILDTIESCSRGIYSGCIGFLSYNQTFDLNIVIRTVVLHEGEASIGAGGAIVALSNPKDEYEEMILKTRAPSMAVTELL